MHGHGMQDYWVGAFRMSVYWNILPSFPQRGDLSRNHLKFNTALVNLLGSKKKLMTNN